MRAYVLIGLFILLMQRAVYAEVPLTDVAEEKYHGELISLNFQTISIRAVLQILAEFTKTNIVVSDTVKGDVTVRLNNIPWDEALDIILQSNNLDKRHIGRILLVASAQELAQKEKETLKSHWEVTNLSPLKSELLQLNFAKASDVALMLKDEKSSLLSKRGVLSVDIRTNTVWIKDTEKQIKLIKSLVKKLDVPVRQVLIESRIVNVARDAMETLGIHFEASKKITADTAEQGNVRDGLNLDFGMPLVSRPALGLALATLQDNVLLDLELSALESADKAKIIATPRLMTTNQQPALIESGEEIPYQEITGTGGTIVAFKKAVLSLRVTPQITSDNKILMDLQISQDTPSGRQVNGVPAILTKQIQTNVLVNNGETVVLGGIYKEDNNRQTSGIPFLSHLPIIGGVFRSHYSEKHHEELLIFITPHLLGEHLSSVRPIEDK